MRRRASFLRDEVVVKADKGAAERGSVQLDRHPIGEIGAAYASSTASLRVTVAKVEAGSMRVEVEPTTRIVLRRTRQFARRLTMLRYLGLRYRCPFCGLMFRRFLPRGSKMTVLEDMEVVGAGRRANSSAHGADRMTGSGGVICS